MTDILEVQQYWSKQMDSQMVGTLRSSGALSELPVALRLKYQPAHCLWQTFIFYIIKSYFITLVTIRLKNQFHVLDSILEAMVLWNFKYLWSHLCVLFNFIHYLLNDPSIISLSLCLWYLPDMHAICIRIIHFKWHLTSWHRSSLNIIVSISIQFLAQ